MGICLRAIAVVLIALILPASLVCTCESVPEFTREPGGVAPVLRVDDRLSDVSLTIDDIGRDGFITYTVTNNTDLEIMVNIQGFIFSLEYFDGDVWRIVPHNLFQYSILAIGGPLVLPYGDFRTFVNDFSDFQILPGRLHRIRKIVTALYLHEGGGRSYDHEVVAEFYFP